MPEANQSLGDTLLRRLKLLTIATVVVYFVVAALAVSSLHSLCTLRGDLEARVVEGQKFLNQHPKGFAGFTADAIKLNLENAERSVNSLSVTPCL
jgi:hypothetical protein